MDLLHEAILGLTAGFRLWEELVLKVGVNGTAIAIKKNLLDCCKNL